MTPEEFTADMKRVALEHLEIGEHFARMWRDISLLNILFAVFCACGREWVGAAICLSFAGVALFLRRKVLRDAIRHRSETLEGMERVLREKGWT